MISVVVTLRVAAATRINVDGGAVRSLDHGYITRDVVRPHRWQLASNLLVGSGRAWYLVDYA